MATTLHNFLPAGTDLAPWIDEISVLRALRRTNVAPTGWRIHRLAVARVFPAKPTGLSVQYRLVLTGGSQVVEGAVYLSPLGTALPERAGTLRISRRGALTLSGLAVSFEEQGILLHTPDVDPMLPGVSEALSATKMTARLKLGRSVRCQVLSYRPGRRCTIAYQNPTCPRASVVGKLYRHPLDTQVLSIQRRLRSELRSVDSCLGAPRIVRQLPDLNMIVSEHVVPVDHRSPANALERAVGAGQILAALHSIKALPEDHFSASDDLRALDRWLELCRRLGRPLRNAETIRDLLERSVWRSIHSRRSLIHRDFYDDQILQTGDGWALVDFDTATTGERELDVANYIAHVFWRNIRTTGSSADASAAAMAFVSSYLLRAGGVRLCPDRLAFYLLGSLVRVSMIHSLRTSEAEAARKLLALAKSIALRDIESLTSNNYGVHA